METCNCDLTKEIDYENLPDCPKAWKILALGHTKGVFQLESQLGKSWSQQLKPTNLKHLAALGSILRPGSLEAKDEKGISITEHYCLRKNKLEPITSQFPALDSILVDTYQLMIFQEQSIKISQYIAGFDLSEADTLRRIVGKKKAKEMGEMEEKFLAGCKRVGLVTEEEAKQIFEIIRASQRYQFNKSHAVAYGMIGYWTAYMKSHYPVEFHTSYLAHAKHKQKPLIEMAELVNSAKYDNIKVNPPDLRMLEPNFYTDKKSIWFGLSDIKGIGETVCKNIIEKLKDDNICKKSWYEFLTTSAIKISPSKLKIIVDAGGCDGWVIKESNEKTC